MKQKIIELWKNDCEHFERVNVIAFIEREPSKEELITLAQGGKQ